MNLTAEKSTTAHTILERCVCLTLECHFIGNDRRLDMDALVRAGGGDKHLDERAFTARKKLIDSKELAPCMAVLGAAKAELRSMAISGHRIFGERSYLVPIGMVARAEARLRELEAELRERAHELAHVKFAPAVARQAELLGPLFNAKDYPTPAEVEAAWGLDWNWVSFAAPERLETVDQALYDLAEQKYERKLGEAFDEVRGALRETLLTILTELVQRLKPGEDGKPRVIRGTALRDITEFLSTIHLRDVTDDPELRRLAEKLQGVVGGVDLDQLRDKKGGDLVRERVVAVAEEARQALDGLVATRRRAVSLGSLEQVS